MSVVSEYKYDFFYRLIRIVHKDCYFQRLVNCATITFSITFDEKGRLETGRKFIYSEGIYTHFWDPITVVQ